MSNSETMNEQRQQRDRERTPAETQDKELLQCYLAHSHSTIRQIKAADSIDWKRQYNVHKITSIQRKLVIV